MNHSWPIGATITITKLDGSKKTVKVLKKPGTLFRYVGSKS